MTTEWSSQGTAYESEKPVTEKAQEEVKNVAGQVQQQVKEVAVQAQEQAKTAITERKDMAATRLTSVAEALRQTGTQLRGQEEDWMARYSNQAADQVENFAGYLENHNVEDLVREAEDFARRQPELFLGGAFTLGLLVARFFKSSRQHNGSRYPLAEYEGSGRYDDYAVPPPYTSSTRYSTTPTATMPTATTTPRSTRSSYETGYGETRTNDQ